MIRCSALNVYIGVDNRRTEQVNDLDTKIQFGKAKTLFQRQNL